MRLVVCILLVLSVTQMCAQQSISDSDLNKLHLKTVYLIGTGTVCALTGIALLGPGIVDMKKGVQHGGLNGIPSDVDYRPAGRIFIVCGTSLFAGGVAMLASGLYYNKLFINKRNETNLTTGCLPNGNIGVVLSF